MAGGRRAKSNSPPTTNGVVHKMGPRSPPPYHLVGVTTQPIYNSKRNSSPKLEAVRTSPSNQTATDELYAGAKFSDPPPPAQLPKPPSHWMMGGYEGIPRSCGTEFAKAQQVPGDLHCNTMTNQLKLLLKVQA